MNRDPAVALVALVLILVIGAAAAVIGAQRADRRARDARRSAAPVRRGRWSLVLDGAGAKKIQVIKELRAVTGLGLAEAKGLTDRTPSTVLSAVDRSTAETAYRTLAEAGAAVRITEDAAAPDDPAPDAAGAFAVVMDDPGGRRIQVIKEIRALTGLGLAEAKGLTDRMPSTILSGVDHATATAAHRALTDAAARVRITEG